MDHLSCREVGVWNKILTGAEVTTAYNSGNFRDNSTIQNSTCKGYWRFNEPIADSAYAVSGPGDHMFYINTANNFLDNEIHGGINRGKVTWSGWVYNDWSSTNNSNKPMIWSNGSSGQFQLYTQTSGVVLSKKYGSTNVTYTWSSQGVSDNTWQHLAIVWDIGATYGDRVLPILYVNGVSKGNATESGSPGSSDVPVLMGAQMHIGVEAGGAGDFGGRHRQYSFWNRLLTSSEVTSLYNSGTPVGGASVQPEDLIADLPLYSQQDKSRNRFSLAKYLSPYIAGLAYTDSMSQNNAACTKIHHKDNIDALGTYKDSSNSIATWDIIRGGNNTPNKLTPDPKRDSYTVMAWMKLPNNNSAQNGVLIEFSRAKPDGSSNYHYRVHHNMFSDRIYVANSYSNGTTQQVYANSAMTFGEWAHVAQVVYPYSSTKSIQTYVNGVKYDHTDSHTAHTRTNTDGIGQAQTYDYENGDHAFTQVLVGLGYGANEYTYPDRELRGKLSDLAIYQGALTHQEISGAYNKGNFISYPSGSCAYDVRNIVTSSCDSWNLVGYWRMGDNGSDSSGQITDESGQGNHMLYSAATVQSDES